MADPEVSQSETTLSNPYSAIPSYLVAANNHNLAAGEDGITDYLKFTAGAAAGALAGQALIPIPIVGAAIGALVGGETARSNGAFMASSLVSGAASFYNTGVEISNWFGADATRTDAAVTLSEFDSDLGEYYRIHKDSADLVGFLGGSLIPMVGATKVYNYGAAALNAAKYGKLGTNFSEATGLLIPTQEKYLAAAITELGSSGSAFTIQNANVLKAFAAGVGEEMIQGAIASTAVLATMKASPILEDMDAKDMAWNILSGALFQGVVGGTIRSATSYGKIRRGVLEAEEGSKPYMFVEELSEGAPTTHRFLNWLDNKLSIPEITAGNEAFKIRKAEELKRNLDDRLRMTAREWTGKDDQLGLAMADVASTFGSIEEAASKLIGLKESARVNNTTIAEKALQSALKNIEAGKATPAEYDLTRNTTVRYLNLHGENAGAVTSDAPVILNIADRLKPGVTIEVKAGSVNAGDRRWNFNSNPKSRWDMVGKEMDEIEARYIWANHPNGAALADGMEIHSSDIPLLEAAYRKGIKGVKLITEDGSKLALANEDGLLGAVTGAKHKYAQRLQNASADNQVISDPAVVEQKLKQMLGVPFSLSKSGESGHMSGAIGWTHRGGSNVQNPIKLNADAITKGTYPLWRLAQTVKHEEGHNIWNLITDIMPGVSANRIDNPLIEAEMVAASKKARPKQWKGNILEGYSERDRVHEIAADTFAYFSFRPHLLDKEAPEFAKIFKQFVRPVNQEMVDALLIKAKKLSNIEIAKMVNMTVGRLEGTAVNTANPISDLFAIQSSAEAYTEKMIAAGRWDAAKGTIPTYTSPSVAKLIVDTTPVSDLNGNVMEGMAIIKQQQRLAQQANNNAVASVVGTESFAQLPTFTERQTSTATRFGPGQTMTASANENYGSVGSYFQQIGAATNRLIKQFSDETAAKLTSSLYSLKTDAPSAIEFSALQTKLRSTPEVYYYNPEGQELVLRRIFLNEQAIARGEKPKIGTVLDPKAAERIPVTSEKTAAMIEDHISRNYTRTSQTKTLQAANSQASNIDSQAFYPIPVNPKDYPYFAFVTDPTITGTNHVSMIYAATEKELDTLISKVRQVTPEFDVSPKNTQLKTLTKGEIERYHKALGDYSREDTISENYINTALFRKGVSSNFVPSTDPMKISDDILQWHLEKDRQLARYAVTTKYSKEFAELRTQGESYTNLSTSKINAASLSKWVETQVHNPYVDYIKTALDITNLNEAPIWTAVNNFVDTKFSTLWNTVSSVWKGSKGSVDADLVNEIFQRVGVKTAYYDAALSALSNHTAPRGDLVRFVSRANSILASLQLRMDPMNAFNNTVGSTVLTGSELKSVLKGIATGNEDAVGALARIKVPGTGDSILSPTKLYADTIKDFFTNPEMKAWASKNGFMTRHLVEYQSILDDLAVRGSESVRDLGSKMEAAYAKFMRIADIGEKLTGNKLAEEFNRFVSAGMMKKITDLGVEQGVLSPSNALSYVNTFVNRTQGNYLASQRPLMFQGAIGQAVGLFQTYQFNMAQQLLRHVADGEAKTAALTLGLQSTVYGLHGLPGFDVINSHIIGTMSGNKNHRDLYDATYGVAGKEVGDWLMYGMASNTLGFMHPDLKMNLYTRGDINPRFYTVVPTQVSDLPIINATGKLFSSMKETMTKIGGGANVWPTVLQGIEHSGINRPLAGLAQTLEAFGNPMMQSYSTSNKGNVIASNDLFSLANLTRIAGAKPLDEAIAVDSAYRLDAYKSKDVEKRNALGEIIKTTVLAGNSPTSDQINAFSEAYAKSGGKQEGFNQYFMGVFKRANTSQANTIVEHLKNPTAKSMQTVMGGYELKDFHNQ